MVRENIVLSAISFLTSPSVQKHPDETKRKFLLSKGLQLDEILAAFARSNNSKPVQKQKNEFTAIMDKHLQEEGHIINKKSPIRPSAPLVVIAAMSSAAIGIVMYFYKFLRLYLWPWVSKFWKATLVKSKVHQTLNVEMNEDTTSQICEMQDQIRSIKSELDQQQIQIMEFSSKDVNALDNIKSDIESMKKIILSKDSFPPPSPSNIPSWQIRKHDGNNNLPEIRNVSEKSNIMKTVESFEEITSPNNNPGVIDNTDNLCFNNEKANEDNSEHKGSFDSYS